MSDSDYEAQTSTAQTRYIVRCTVVPTGRNTGLACLSVRPSRPG